MTCKCMMCDGTGKQPETGDVATQKMIAFVRRAVGLAIMNTGAYHPVHEIFLIPGDAVDMWLREYDPNTPEMGKLNWNVAEDLYADTSGTDVDGWEPPEGDNIL